MVPTYVTWHFIWQSVGDYIAASGTIVPMEVTEQSKEGHAHNRGIGKKVGGVQRDHRVCLLLMIISDLTSAVMKEGLTQHNVQVIHL